MGVADGSPSKVCPQCHIDKPFDKFYRDRSRYSGLSSWCKDCDAKRFRDRTKAAAARERDARWPKKHQAHAMVRQAIIAGKLTKLPCFLCAESDEAKLDAHHLNYDFPTKIIWLCRKHHYEVHHEI